MIGTVITGSRSRSIRVALVCAAIVLVGDLLVSTVVSLHRGGGGEPVVGEVQTCERYGPVGDHGIGYYWRCQVQIRAVDGTGEVTIDRSVVTPADVGEQVRLREDCGDDRCDYGRPSLWIWSFLTGSLVFVWWWIRLAALIVGAFELVAAIVGPGIADRWRAKMRESEREPKPLELPENELAVAPSDAAGLTIHLRHPESVALYESAQPVVRIDGETTTVTWGTHSFPVKPGRHQVDVVVVAYDTPLHTSRASAEVKVPRQRGVEVTYEAPAIGR